MEIHQQFRELIELLKQEKGNNIQQALKRAAIEDIPTKYHKSFTFFKSLSGPSRNLFIDATMGRKKNKIHSGRTSKPLKADYRG